MALNGTPATLGAAGALLLPDNYRTLNEQRIELDQRIAALEPDDPARDMLWQDLQLLLVRLREVISDLAGSPATSLDDVRAKAGVLATLLKADQIDGGPVVDESEKSALALSLTEDIGRLSTG